MITGNPIFNKRLVKFWPEEGCIREGWDDAIESMPKVSLPIRGGEFRWSLGTPERFRVAIHYGYDRKDEVTKAIAMLFWKNSNGKFEVADTLPVHSANDILEVVMVLDTRFEKETSPIASQWNESMASLPTEMETAETALAETYASGDWGDWETSWDCADFDADEDATFLQDVVEIWRFMEIDDSTPRETLKAYIRFTNARNAFRSQTREATGDQALEEDARIPRIQRICRRRNAESLIYENDTRLKDTPPLLTRAHIAQADAIAPEDAYKITVATLRNGISDETLPSSDTDEIPLNRQPDNASCNRLVGDTLLDDWYVKMRTRLMRTEHLPDLFTLAALLYEIESYRRC